MKTPGMRANRPAEADVVSMRSARARHFSTAALGDAADPGDLAAAIRALRGLLKVLEP
jgi:hypothetical protein